MNENRPRYSGFTLMELLVVIGIIGAISSIGVVSFAAVGRNMRIESAANAIKDRIFYARTSAITQRRKFAIRMTVTPTRKVWKLQTFDSGSDNVIDYENDLTVDTRPYYLDHRLNIKAEPPIEIEFSPEGGITYASHNPIVIEDKTEPQEIWEMPIQIYKAAGIARVKPINRIFPDDNKQVQAKAADNKQVESEDAAFEALGLD